MTDDARSALRETKIALRAAMRAKLREFPAEERAAASLAICRSAVVLTIFQEAKTVALFVPLSSEPDITPLIEKAWAQKKRVVLPVMGRRGKAPWLHWHLVAAWTELTVTGPFGLREPDPERCPSVETEAIDCVFIPGLAFDAGGGRMGRGGGYYDSFLAEAADVPAVGLFFELQRVDQVPREAHDALLGGVITEVADLPLLSS